MAPPIPGLWLAPRVAARLRALLDRGPVRAVLTTTGRRSDVMTNNVVGVLEGAGPGWVVIGSHHDGPSVSAVEDASGVGLVLAQAEHWSRVPRQRSRTTCCS